MNPLAGVRVIEMASYVFVPAAGTVLADWGAEVIKVEHPITGDPVRGMTATSQAGRAMTASAAFHCLNRGKRSVGIDVSSAHGRSVLKRLVETADVFLTNLLPHVRQKLLIDVEHLRQHNPQIIYAKGSGVGPRGAEKDRGGFDYASYWSRGGIAATFQSMHPSLEYPPRQVGGFGDIPSGAVLAGGIAAALAGRALHGEPSVVDTSLLSFALWQLSSEVSSAGQTSSLRDDRGTGRSVTTAEEGVEGIYRTKDSGLLAISVTRAQFPTLCSLLGHSDLVDRTGDLDEELAASFATRTMEEWIALLRQAQMPCNPVQTVQDVLVDPQARQNGYVIPVAEGEGPAPFLASTPVQFNEQPHRVLPAPSHGEHTDEVLLSCGYGWDELIELKLTGGVT